jgi:hypothetical protein
MIKKIGCIFSLIFLLQGCTILNTPVKEDWYNTQANYTWVGLGRGDIQKIQKGSDLKNFPYKGSDKLYLQYKKTISGGDSAAYYANTGSYIGFVYGAGPDKANLNVKIDILKRFVTWANQTKEKRLATEGIHVELYASEYIYLEHPDGPIMLARVTGNTFYCIMSTYCYAAFINPSSAKIMIEELSFLRDTKFKN